MASMPDNVTTNLKILAEHLLACEKASDQRAKSPDLAALRVCEKLRELLCKLMGVGGFRSLLSRAVDLAGEESPWLRGLRINRDGSLDGLIEIKTKLDTRLALEGELALISHLLKLLVTFIGAGLTLRLLRSIWPKIDELNLE